MPTKSTKPKKQQISVESNPTTSIHPFSHKIDELRRRVGWSQKKLAEHIGKSHQQVSRLLNMKGKEQLPLDLIKAIFEVFAPGTDIERRSVFQRAQKDKAWNQYLQKTNLDKTFFELATSLTRQGDRFNPYDWLFGIQDDELWQRTHQPGERWLITDVITETCYPELMPVTCDQLINNLNILVFFIPGRAISEFENFYNLAQKAFDEKGLGENFEEVFKNKVMCIEMPDWSFFFRMRIDDPRTRSQSRSSVLSLGPVNDPILVRMDEHTTAEVFKRLNTVVDRFRQVAAGEKSEREFSSSDQLTFTLRFPKEGNVSD